MKERIRKFLCTMDPLLATQGVIILIMFGLLIKKIGLAKVALLCGLGLCMFVVVFGVGFGIYKTIEYAQSKCKENQ